MEEIIDTNNLKDNPFFQGIFDINNINEYFNLSNELLKLEPNDNNPFFNEQIISPPNQLNSLNENNGNPLNFTQDQNIPYSHYSFINTEKSNLLTVFHSQNLLYNFYDRNNNPKAIYECNSSSSISPLMIEFQSKLYPLLKKFFIDFANKLINDEPIQIAVIDLEKTCSLDYDLGYYSLPLDIDKFKYKIYNLFDNLRTITRILKLSIIIHHKLSKLMPCTKRELYYENVDLFKSTDIIDSTESDLCSILGVCRFDLPVFPSAKGLFCGNITLVNKYGHKLNINNFYMNNKINLINYEYLIEDFDLDEYTKNNINLIQNNSLYIGNNNKGKISRNNINDISNKYFVLIIEKETLFFNLIGNYKFFKKFPNSIIITGKGYPDYITKVFIKKLYNLVNNIPFIYFGDHDPHGFEIYLNYIFGSIQSSKENNFMSLGNIKWIGLSHENIEAILKFGYINNEIKKEMYEDGVNNVIINNNEYLNNENLNQEIESGLIKLDNKDKLKIENMLKREYFNLDEKWIKSTNPFSEKIMTNLKVIQNELILMENYEYKAEGEYLVSKYFNDFLFLIEEAIY